MRYLFRTSKSIAIMVYLVMVVFLPIPWLTHPYGSPMPDQASENKHATASRTRSHIWKKNVLPARPVSRYSSSFREGISMSTNRSYSQALIISRLASEDVSWVSTHLPHFDRYIYTTDDADALRHTPQNKGHEAMVYLTHLVEHYYGLADINIFMHKGRFTHHNEGLLDYDAVKMISRLRGSYVVRNGYINLQCDWAKSCPSWLNGSDTWPNMEKQEQVYLSRVWEELFPSKGIPITLGAPCCAQYAISKERIRAIPLAKFVFIRDWLIRTPLTDYVSGRLWEYLWHYLFTGEYVRCPLEHICLCDGYGLCFGGEEGYRTFKQLRVSKEVLRKEVDQRYIHERNGTSAAARWVSDVARIKYLAKQIAALEHEQNERLASAIAQGDALFKQTEGH